MAGETAMTQPNFSRSREDKKVDELLIRLAQLQANSGKSPHNSGEGERVAVEYFPGEGKERPSEHSQEFAMRGTVAERRGPDIRWAGATGA